MARLGFCGACPTETETSRREAGFHRVFLAYKPIWKDALKYSVAWSKSYISLSTLLASIPCYTGHVYTSKAFDAS